MQLNSYAKIRRPIYKGVGLFYTGEGGKKTEKIKNPPQNQKIKKKFKRQEKKYKSKKNSMTRKKI